MILKSLKYPNEFIKDVIFLTKNHMRTKHWGDDCKNMRIRSLRKLQFECGKKYFDDLMILIDADNNAHAETGNRETGETGSRNTTDNSTKSLNDTTNLNGEVNSTEEYLEKVSGKIGSGNYSEMLMKYRKTFLNIDMMVINELEDLFFGLW